LAGRPIEAEQHQVMVADCRKTTHVLECRDTLLLELDAVAVNERQTAMVLKVDRVDSSTRWKRSGGIDRTKPGGTVLLSDADSRVFMPRLGDDEDVEVVISDNTAQRCRFIAYKLSIYAAKRKVIGPCIIPVKIRSSRVDGCIT